MLWYQGLDRAPLVVKKCVESWIRENPGWDVVVLDAESLKRYVTPDLPPDKLARLDLTKQSNLVRLQLLADFGGVWADATVLCLRPLDEWIDECTASGFFAFAFPDGHSRVLSTWFLVSERHCPIVVKWRQRYASFFLDHDLDANTGRARDLAKRALTRVLDRSRRTTRYWLSPVVTRLLRVYPYYVFSYLFERLIATDPECRTIWDSTAKATNEGSRTIRRFGFFSPLTDEVKKNIDRAIETGHSRIVKLTWKYEPSLYSSSTVLHYLLEARRPGGAQRVRGEAPSDATPSG
jgi:hypothetical protein